MELATEAVDLAGVSSLSTPSAELDSFLEVVDSFLSDLNGLNLLRPIIRSEILFSQSRYIRLQVYLILDRYARYILTPARDCAI